MLKKINNYVSPCNLVIVAVNILVFAFTEIASALTDSGDIIEQGGLVWTLVFEEKEYYRLLTSMFMHYSASHLVNNMLILIFIGTVFERIIGRFKYVLIYIVSGIVAGMTSIGYNRWCYYASLEIQQRIVISIGASGAVFGIAGAMVWIVIRNKGQIEGISTMRMLLFLLLSVYLGIMDTGIDNAAHIGGAVFGFISAVILYARDA